MTIIPYESLNFGDEHVFHDVFYKNER